MNIKLIKMNRKYFRCLFSILAFGLIPIALGSCGTMVQVDPEFDNFSSQARRDCRGDEVVGVWVTQVYRSVTGTKTKAITGYKRYVLKIEKNGTWVCWTKGLGGTGLRENVFVNPPWAWDTTGSGHGPEWKYMGNGMWQFSFDYMNGTSSIRWTGDKLLWSHDSRQKFVFVRAEDEEAVASKIK